MKHSDVFFQNGFYSISACTDYACNYCHCHCSTFVFVISNWLATRYDCTAFCMPVITLPFSAFHHRLLFQPDAPGAFLSIGWKTWGFFFFLFFFVKREAFFPCGLFLLNVKLACLSSSPFDLRAADWIQWLELLGASHFLFSAIPFKLTGSTNPQLILN